MNAKIRAHRILTAFENYEKVGHKEDWPPELSDATLGEPVGIYRNPGPHNEVIAIFADGMTWPDSDRVVAVKFVDIVDVSLTQGKKSERLLLKLRGGRNLQLPVRGHRGRFFDSLGMLRFLNRVVGDLRRP